MLNGAGKKEIGSLRDEEKPPPVQYHEPPSQGKPQWGNGREGCEFKGKRDFHFNKAGAKGRKTLGKGRGIEQHTNEKNIRENRGGIKKNVRRERWDVYSDGVGRSYYP